MARDERRADELSALLSDLDAAVAARFPDVRRRAQATGLRGVVATALRWLGRRPSSDAGEAPPQVPGEPQREVPSQRKEVSHGKRKASDS